MQNSRLPKSREVQGAAATGQPSWLLGRNLKIKIRIVRGSRLASSSMRCLYRTLQTESMKIGKKKKVIMIKYSVTRQKTKA